MIKFDHHNAMIRICLDKQENGHPIGRVFSQRLAAPLAFSDVGSLILQLDEILDAQDFPQAFQQTRTFLPKGPAPSLAVEAPGLGLSAQEVEEARGSLFTCDVFVITRRNSSWQGFVIWTDKGERQPYSSALELIHLLDLRLSSQES